MSYSRLTNNLKSQVTPLLDDYAQFAWAGHDMWDEFGAFIINEKSGSLQFYGGPTFSNTYIKPQFETASSKFNGVTFNTAQISFKIGVYAITEALYRKLLYILNPYTIDNLIFKYDPSLRYIVKLAKVGNGTKYIVGKDGNQNLFYTELSLTFDIQGPAVAHSVTEVSYDSHTTVTTNANNDITKTVFHFGNYTTEHKIQSEVSSDLPTPFVFTMKVQGSTSTNYSNPITVSLQAQQINWKEDNNCEAATDNLIELFTVNFKHLTSGNNLELQYNSETGDLVLMRGTNTELLSLLTTHDNGLRMISSIVSNKFVLPGLFSDNLSLSNIELILSIDNYGTIDYTTTNGYGINCSTRTTTI